MSILLWITIEMEYKINCLKFILFFTNGRQKLTAKGLSMLYTSFGRIAIQEVPKILPVMRKLDSRMCLHVKDALKKGACKKFM